jgi:hypothetical protein
MSGLLAAVLAFVLLLVAQFIVWRVVRPSGHYLPLLGLYLVALLATVGVFRALGGVALAAAWLVPGTIRDVMNFLTLYTAGTMAYIVTYSAVQADSPSMMILLQIEQGGASGLRREAMMTSLGDSVVVLPRLQDLVTGGLATIDAHQRYVITPRGTMLARLYIAYRTLLRMEKGG